MDVDKGVFLHEEESLKNTGEWKQLTLFARGDSVCKINHNKEKNNTTLILKTGRFDNIGSAVIISSVSKVVQN